MSTAHYWQDSEATIDGMLIKKKNWPKTENIDIHWSPPPEGSGMLWHQFWSTDLLTLRKLVGLYFKLLSGDSCMSPALLQVKALGCDGSTSLASWLDSLGLHEYLPNFLSNGYRTLECVKNLWELELVNVRTAFSPLSSVTEDKYR